MSRPEAPVTSLRTAVYRFPTAEPEADGTFQWDATTAVTAEVHAGGCQGLGWTYSSSAAAAVIRDQLIPAITGIDAYDVPAGWTAMVRATRNLGRGGIVSQAIAAVDIALWDLKAKLMNVTLHDLFGRARDTIPVYGSGGFTTMTDDQLAAQVETWRTAGCHAIKIKVGESWGTEVVRDLHRVAFAKSLVPDSTAMMVDANGGYTTGQAARLGHVYDSLGVTWFEEPVSSDDLASLAGLRTQLRCDVAAGEYADSTQYVQRMCSAGAVDCLQLDVTRCAGYSEWIRCAGIAAAHGLQVSGHCAPALHASVAAAIPNLRHVEWFADHVRLEPQLVTGVPAVSDGVLHLGDAPGHGMSLRPDVERFAG